MMSGHPQIQTKQTSNPVFANWGGMSGCPTPKAAATIILIGSTSFADMAHLPTSVALDRARFKKFHSNRGPTNLYTFLVRHHHSGHFGALNPDNPSTGACGTDLTGSDFFQFTLSFNSQSFTNFFNGDGLVPKILISLRILGRVI